MPAGAAPVSATTQAAQASRQHKVPAASQAPAGVQGSASGAGPLGEPKTLPRMALACREVVVVRWWMCRRVCGGAAFGQHRVQRCWRGRARMRRPCWSRVLLWLWAPVCADQGVSTPPARQVHPLRKCSPSITRAHLGLVGSACSLQAAGTCQEQGRRRRGQRQGGHVGPLAVVGAWRGGCGVVVEGCVGRVGSRSSSRQPQQQEDKRPGTSPSHTLVLVLVLTGGGWSAVQLPGSFAALWLHCWLHHV